MRFPSHKAGLYLSHNSHKGCYEKVKDWIEEHEEEGRRFFDWVSPEERQRAIETDSVWTLQWYPESPISFKCLAASSLDALLEKFSAGRLRPFEAAKKIAVYCGLTDPDQTQSPETEASIKYIENIVRMVWT